MPFTCHLTIRASSFDIMTKGPAFFGISLQHCGNQISGNVVTVDVPTLLRGSNVRGVWGRAQSATVRKGRFWASPEMVVTEIGGPFFWVGGEATCFGGAKKTKFEVNLVMKLDTNWWHHDMKSFQHHRSVTPLHRDDADPSSLMHIWRL